MSRISAFMHQAYRLGKIHASNDKAGAVRETVVNTRGLVALGSLVAVVIMLLAVGPSTGTQAATTLLPDLGMYQLSQLSIDTTTISGHKLLRFTSRIVNGGQGAFEIEGTRPDTSSPWTVYQHIFDSSGSYSSVATNAQLVYAGDNHNHWHVKDLASFELDRLDNGVKVGTGAKSGFCFNDNFQYNLSLAGAPQSAYYGPVVPNCAGGQPNALTVYMGLSVGWGDTYGYNLMWQWVDITGLAAGRYRLKAQANATKLFTESNTANNCTWTDIQLQGNASHFKVLSSAPTFSNC